MPKITSWVSEILRVGLRSLDKNLLGWEDDPENLRDHPPLPP